MPFDSTMAKRAVHLHLLLPYAASLRQGNPNESWTAGMLIIVTTLVSQALFRENFAGPMNYWCMYMCKANFTFLLELKTEATTSDRVQEQIKQKTK